MRAGEANWDLVEEVVPLARGELRVMRPRDSEALLDEEAFEHEEFLPYWAELWPSGVALARDVSARALRGARTLELGCGLALPSIAAALAGGRVVASDWSVAAIDLARRNAESSGVEIETLVCDWSHPESLVERGPWELVLASDVLYERRNAHALARLLPRLVGPGRRSWSPTPAALPLRRSWRRSSGRSSGGRPRAAGCRSTGCDSGETRSRARRGAASAPAP